jgi:hypothetical protein
LLQLLCAAVVCLTHNQGTLLMPWLCTIPAK